MVKLDFFGKQKQVSDFMVGRRTPHYSTLEEILVKDYRITREELRDLRRCSTSEDHYVSLLSGKISFYQAQDFHNDVAKRCDVQPPKPTQKNLLLLLGDIV